MGISVSAHGIPTRHTAFSRFSWAMVPPRNPNHGERARACASEGVVRVWVNGGEVYQKFDESFTRSSDSASTRWSWLTARHHREAASCESTIHEVRYWDSVAFGTNRIGQ
jgi:hypothetical protein